MTLSHAAFVPPPRARTAQLHVWVTASLAAALWFDVMWDAARRAPVLALAAPVAALAGLGTQLAFTALEACAAIATWRVAGTHIRWRSLAPRLLAVSAAEAFAVSIAAGVGGISPALAVWLAGPRSVPGFVPASGPAHAFGAFGVLTIVRLLLSAHEQAGVASRSFARAVSVVLTLYLATRLAMWWTFDLMQGRSFAP